MKKKKNLFKLFIERVVDLPSGQGAIIVLMCYFMVWKMLLEGLSPWFSYPAFIAILLVSMNIAGGGTEDWK